MDCFFFSTELAFSVSFVNSGSVVVFHAGEVIDFLSCFDGDIAFNHTFWCARTLRKDLRDGSLDSVASQDGYNQALAMKNSTMIAATKNRSSILRD